MKSYKRKTRSKIKENNIENNYLETINFYTYYTKGTKFFFLLKKKLT